MIPAGAFASVAHVVVGRTRRGRPSGFPALGETRLTKRRSDDRRRLAERMLEHAIRARDRSGGGAMRRLLSPPRGAVGLGAHLGQASGEDEPDPAEEVAGDGSSDDSAEVADVRVRGTGDQAEGQFTEADDGVVET